jgi:hypothetical protein
MRKGGMIKCKLGGLKKLFANNEGMEYIYV